MGRGGHCLRFRQRSAFINRLVFPDRLSGGGLVGEDAALAAGDGTFVDLGQPLGEFGFFGGVVRITREVGPLIGIFDLVVEFFAAVGVADVAPVFGADGVVALIVGGDGGPFATRGLKAGVTRISKPAASMSS